MANLLLIYEFVPEQTHLIYLKDADAETERKLRLVHGTYVNSDDMSKKQHEIHDEINEHLAENKEHGDGAWRPFLMDDKTPVAVEAGTTIIRAGFFL